MAAATIPTLRDGDVTLRPIRARDAKPLERVLLDNRGWLRQWEADGLVRLVCASDVRGALDAL